MSETPTKQCSNCNEIKDLTEFSKNKSKKDGLQSQCKACHNANSKAWNEANKEEYNANKKAWYEANKEAENAKSRAWREANKEKAKANSKAYTKNNPDKVKASTKAWYEANKEEHKANQKAYRKANPDKRNALVAKRKAQKLQATPLWLTEEDLQQIEAFYTESSRLTKETGIKHNVDHIIPLQGKEIRGLHVPWNLQILTASENISKGNKVII